MEMGERRQAKDEINVPIALSAFRDKERRPKGDFVYIVVSSLRLELWTLTSQYHYQRMVRRILCSISTCPRGVQKVVNIKLDDDNNVGLKLNMGEIFN